MERSHRSQRIQFDGSLQFGGQVSSDALSNEKSGCEGSSGERMEEARDGSSMGFEKVKSEKEVAFGNTERQKESPLCHTDGRMPPQKCEVGTQIF